MAQRDHFRVERAPTQACSAQRHPHSPTLRRPYARSMRDDVTMPERRSDGSGASSPALFSDSRTQVSSLDREVDSLGSSCVREPPPHRFTRGLRPDEANDAGASGDIDTRAQRLRSSARSATPSAACIGRQSTPGRGNAIDAGRSTPRPASRHGLTAFDAPHAACRTHHHRASDGRFKFERHRTTRSGGCVSSIGVGEHGYRPYWGASRSAGPEPLRTQSG